MWNGIYILQLGIRNTDSYKSAIDNVGTRVDLVQTPIEVALSERFRDAFETSAIVR